MAVRRTLSVLVVILFVFRGIEAVSSIFPDVGYIMEGTTSGLLVETSVGTIRGLRAEDGDYSMFMGIPYAEIDHGNPFGASTPYPAFEGIFDAYDDSAICPQIEEFNHTIVGSLDCLHLNVYVPDRASGTNRLPVMVWIYGGGFTIGFAGRFLYGPKFLVRHDVILVTINYRVGPYGFMCLDTPEVPGNQGLKDQLIALRWIKNNIAAFGGDDSKITLFGNSAGGVSIDHYVRYGEEDIFQQIILQSGVSLVATSMRASNPSVPILLSEHLNYTPSDLADALAFISKLHAHEVIGALDELGLEFRPCVEKEFDNVENFITVHPVNTKAPRVRHLKAIIGFNSDEMYAAYSNMNSEHFENSDITSSLMNTNFDFGDTVELYDDMKRIVNHFYLGDDDKNAEERRPVINMASDFNFNHPSLRTVRNYLNDGVETLYLYMLSYSGGRNFVKHRVNITGGGAVHADELGYLFDISYMDKPLDPNDELIVDRMTLLWTNFAKYGNPTPETTELVPLIWPQVTQDKWHYLDLDTELRLSSRPYHDRMAFFDLFYKKNEQYQRGYEREEKNSAGKMVAINIRLTVLFIIYFMFF